MKGNELVLYQIITTTTDGATMSTELSKLLIITFITEA